MYLFSKNNKKSYLKQTMFYFLTQITLLFSDQYSVTSKSDLEFLNKNFLYTNKILLRPNWVEVNLVKTESKENNKILAVGRLEEQKNFKELIKGVKNTDFVIDIYGEGTQKDELFKLASKLKVPLQIFDFVNNDDLLVIYQQYKYFVSTANFEGNSKVILEAMASGCVVIAKNIDNNRELIDDKKSGLLFSENLNEILINCQKNEYEFEEIARNAKSKVMNNFTLTQISNSYAKDFNNLLKTN
jgi:glycosyltransferase involved in cell wall biosynthesis